MEISPLHVQNPSNNRKSRGFRKSPYAFSTTVRYFANAVTGGKVSYPLSKSVHLYQEQSSDKPIIARILFMGDLMMSMSGSISISDGVRTIMDQADAIFVNIESPIVQESTGGRKGLKFKMGVDYVKRLFTHDTTKIICSVSNNHACDLVDEDEKCVQTTTQTLKSNINNCFPIGANTDYSSAGIIVMIKNNIKIGIIAWTEVMNSDGYSKDSPAGKTIVWDTWIDAVDIEEFKRTNEIDILIGFPHGGVEQSLNPEPITRQKWIGLVERGFDVIIGHGPHVVQPVESYGQKIIFHSIGNFYGPKGGRHTETGLLPELLIHDDGSYSFVTHRLRQDRKSERVELE